MPADPPLLLLVLPEDPPVARGQMRLYDDARPPMPPGDWELIAEQTVVSATVSDGKSPASGPTQVMISGVATDVSDGTPSAMKLRIHGPRYALDPTEVLAEYPAPGPFAETDRLPHVVLRRRTLPWERRIHGASGNIGARFAAGDAPWVALLLLRPGEIDGGKILLNQPIPGQSLDSGVRVALLPVRWGTLRAILPRASELPLLCHVRQVSLQDRELRADDDGFVAIVASNRAPVPPKAGASGAYIAALVSLEGCGHLWTDGTGGDPLGDKRPADTLHHLVVLHHWAFEAGDGATFAMMTKRLSEQGIDRMGVLAPEPNLPLGALTLMAEGAEGGEASVVYRGPAVPVPVARDGTGPATAAPIHVAPDGRQEISERSAFELGRLLALGPPAILSALLQYREGQYNVVLRKPPLEVPVDRLKDLLDHLTNKGCFVPGEGGKLPPIDWTKFGGGGDDPWAPGGGTPGPDDGIDPAGWLKTLVGRGGGLVNLFPKIGGPSTPGVPGSPGGLPGAQALAYEAASLNASFGALLADVRTFNVVKEG